VEGEGVHLLAISEPKANLKALDKLGSLYSPCANAATPWGLMTPAGDSRSVILHNKFQLSILDSD
jgi:hypothetical protein